MKMAILFVFLMFLGKMNSEGLHLSGRPLLRAIISDKPNVIKVLKHELAVPASADKVWAVYSAPTLAFHLSDLLPGAFEKVEVFGDGGVGTIIDMTFAPGEFPHEYKEKFILIDGKQRLKKVQMIEGGYLDLGVTYYMDTIHVVPTGSNSCIIKSSTEYHVKPEAAKLVEPLITTEPLAAMAEVITKIVLENKSKSSEENQSSEAI